MASEESSLPGSAKPVVPPPLPISGKSGRPDDLCTPMDDGIEIKEGDNDQQVRRAETRTEQAEARTEEAEARTEQAKTRTEQAEVRTEQAETRTEQAELRTEQAETRTEQAKTRTGEAEIRAEQAETQSEQAIRASELRYRRLFETAQDGILILDADSGQVMDANPFMKDLLGYSQEEFLGRKLWEIGPFKGEAASRLTFAELQREDRIRYEGLPLETKEGKRVEVEFISNTYLVDTKKLIQCNIRDITSRKEIEEQLLWKTAFFEAQVHSSLDGILIVDRNGKKVLQNQQMADLWNIPPSFAEETDDRRQLEWVTNQVKSPEQFAEKIAYLHAHPDEISHDEVELLNGTFFDRYSAPVRGKDGKDYGRIWAFRDITERKKSEAQIVEQAAFLDKARDAILVRDLEGKIIFWNKGAERMYGWVREEVIDKERDGLLQVEPEKYKKGNELTISEGEWHGELKRVTKDQREITVEARWTLIRGNDGQPKSVLEINTDITERKKIEGQFLRAQRMESIGTLAGGIAHDLNNILAPIMMAIEILKTTSADEQAQKILGTIEVSARRGADIVRQVLSFARGLEGQRIEVQPAHLLKDLECIIRDTFPKDIQLQFSVPIDTWTILGDPTQVHQILLNLCVNARDAMPDGGKLAIGVENWMMDEQSAGMNLPLKAGRYVNISVTDSGTGIPQRIIDKIFEPFFTTKELNKGTGLGLSTVMAIVKSHEGTINVYSEPGKGTTFKVYLPAMEISTVSRGAVLEEVSLPRGDGETILVVDDEASILSITGQTLQAFGYRVITATDGANAVAIFAERKNEIAVVLTDMMMPVMDGAAMIHVLTRIQPTVKIVATSGLNSNRSATKMSGNGVKHFLTKPYTAANLLKTMQTILSEK
jgi:PAS domain S-box-containing protein